MKNFRSIRILLALLLSLCMLFSGIPVFAVEGETDFVTVEMNEDGEADVTVTVDKAEGDCGEGIRVHAGTEVSTVIVDGYWKTDEESAEEESDGDSVWSDNLVEQELWNELDEEGNPRVASASVTADSVTEEIVISPADRADYDSGDHLGAVEAIGITAIGDEADIGIQVQDGVQVSIVNDPEKKKETGTEHTWGGDSVDGGGILIEADQGNVSVATCDVDVNLAYTDTDEEQETWLRADLDGLSIQMNADDYYDHVSQEGEASKGTVEVGNVTVTAESDTAEPYLNLTGIEASAGSGSEMTLEAQDVTVKAEAEGDDLPDDIQRGDDNKGAYGAEATGIESYGNITMTVEDVLVDAKMFGENIYAEVIGVRSGGENNTVNASSVSAKAVTEEQAWATGVWTGGEGEVNVENNVDAYAEGENAYAYAVSADESATVTTGSVTAETKSTEGYSTATAIFAQDAGVEANGDVEAVAEGVISNATGIQACGDSKVVADGDVKAEAVSTDTENMSSAVGIQINAIENTVTTVIASGDVSGTGDDAAGIRIESGTPPVLSEEPAAEPPTVNVIAGGTVSGSTVAVEVFEDETLSAEDVNLTLWAAEENEDQQIAVVYTDESGNGDFAPNEEATAALEKAINYIVKFATGLTFDAITTQKGNTVEFLDEKYHTANEDELVSVKASDTDEKELSGIFYNAEDESTLQEVKGLNKDENGNYQIRMKRGGGMQLGLQWHTHIYDTREKDRVEPTCTEDGSVIVETYCTQCGKVAVTETKVLPKGHTPGEAKKENETAATCKAEGSYDMVVRCLVCNEIISSEHFVTEKLEHTPGEAVRENEVPATERTNGSYDEVIYCTACGAEISRETKVIPKLQDTDSGNNNQNGRKKTTADLLEVVIVVADEQSGEVLSLVDDAGKTGNILSFLPDEIKDEIPADFSTVKTRNAMKIVGDIEEAVSFDAVFEFETPFTAGDTVYLLIAFTGVDGQTTWYLLKGEVNKDGNVVANLTSLLSILGNQQFVVLTVTK